MTTQELQERDRQYVWHPFTHMAGWMREESLVIVGGEGMYLIDSEGRRYLDGVSSLWCNVHGHRVPEIDEAIRGQLGKIAHSTLLGLGSEQSILLAERLMGLVPRNLKKVFYSDSGATATEVAFKMAVQYWHNVGKPQKKEFVGFAEAYHGDTFGAMSVGRTEGFHRAYWPMLFPVHVAPTPHRRTKEECLGVLEGILKEHGERIAGVCIEPLVQGAAGMLVHPEGFLRGVRELATRYGVLMIADEVAVGFGRTGTMFACEQEGVEPDLMCVAKGITGGYLALAATFATQEIFDAFLGEPWEGRTFFHGHTYTGNALACAAAMASLDLFEKRGLIAAVQRKARVLEGMLEPIGRIEGVGQVRQKGMMVGIELVGFDIRRRVGAEVCGKVRGRGVILRPLGDVIVIMPPLAMEEGEIGVIVEAVGEELRAIGR